MLEALPHEANLAIASKRWVRRAVRRREVGVQDLNTAIVSLGNRIDVSIILNLHREARYFRRTMLSLEEAVVYAKQFDISFELVVVIDNGDEATTRVAAEWDYAAFAAHRILHVQNRSLGLSRNDGLAVAQGEYVATADADDLVAFDYFQRLYMRARSDPGRVIVFPELYVAFGIQNYVWKFYDIDYIGPSNFFYQHPYVSRFLAHRSILSDVAFADASVSSGYAYEDWHFNCECLAADIRFAVAKGSILFYRQTPGSLLRQADSQTSKNIPYSKYFIPNRFLKIAWNEFSGDHARKVPDERFDYRVFLKSLAACDIVHAANKIEPAISLGVLRHGHFDSNLPRMKDLARIYFEICATVAGTQFTDILVVPFMAKGGAEKYVFSVLDAIDKLQPDTRLLVLGTQSIGRHEWIDKLPDGSVFLDLHELGSGKASPSDLELIVFRLIQHLPGLRRVHMKNCEFVDAFARRFMRYLKDVDTTFYYFCDPQVVVEGDIFVNGQCFDLVAEVGTDLTRVISDHRGNLDLIEDRVGTEFLPRREALYNSCDLAPTAKDPKRGPTRRLLWASRIDEQKRPHLVRKIAEALAAEGIDVQIDAYGGTTYGLLGPEVFKGASNLFYRGNYDGFGAVPAQNYDALLYTAAFDGLPNVILEAMGAGLPVIAPDVGGIGEAVSVQTGYLLPDDGDEGHLVKCFVDAIVNLYGNWPEAVRRGDAARKLIASRHSAENFQLRVAEIFDMQSGDVAKPQISLQPA